MQCADLKSNKSERSKAKKMLLFGLASWMGRLRRLTLKPPDLTAIALLPLEQDARSHHQSFNVPDTVHFVTNLFPCVCHIKLASHP